MAKKPVISYQFVDMPADKQETVKDIVQKNLEGKMDSYFKKIYANKDTAEIRIEYKIIENKQKKYEGSFNFNFDGKTFLYNNKIAFKFVEDIVNHAFKHCKEFLSKQDDS
ncbi:MAG: hypothetical protein NTY80_03315 [candidate division SR1 bacterium]|nr:hypothetical protein [candidate division SR1 bacterium]